MTPGQKKYLPFLTGTYTTAPGLIAIVKYPPGRDQFVFQMDEEYSHYLDNKKKCRTENIHKYYLAERLKDETIVHVNQYIVNQLLCEYPEIFQLEENGGNYLLHNSRTGEKLHWQHDWKLVEGEIFLSLFDALCHQVQEDLAVVQMTAEDNKDFLTAIHLCSPNHWAPSDKIGKPFNQVHEPVPGMEKVIEHYPKLLANIVNTKGPYTRFAWGIATDTRLNHHPEPPSGVNISDWQGRNIEKDHPLFVRTERQNLIGFPEVNAFLFTIRTYFYDTALLAPAEKQALVTALDSMTEKTLEYKGLTGQVEKIKQIIVTS